MHIALTIAAAAAAAAAAPQPLPNAGQSEFVSAMQNCQSIKDDAGRLACYDRSVGALVAASARGDDTVVDRNQMRRARRSLFGLAIPQLPFFSDSKDRDVADEPREIVAKLASFRSIGNGLFRFSLDEPQSTWESTEASDIFDPRIGGKVTVSHGALGSYWVEIEGRSARVRRLN
jgi:hypothetical protein